MTLPVIITRAEPGATETSERVAGLGLVPVKLPALQIVPLNFEIEPPGHESVYIFTSANGVRAAVEQKWRRDLPAVCVGPATVNAAEAAGWTTLYNANGNSDDVFALIIDTFSPACAPDFIHVANAAAAGDLATRLRDAGYQVRFAALYETAETPVSAIEHELVENLRDGAVILIHSAKGAANVAKWLAAVNAETRNITLVAVSEKAAAPLCMQEFSSIVIAQRPNEDELMKALQSHCEQGV